MIISASRRTDVAAFYSQWFANRVEAGYCTVPNPFNRKQVSYVSLKPKDVDVIIFWTRNPKPLFSHLVKFNQQGFHYYFQYTVLNNPRIIDEKVPDLETSLKTFKALAELIGPERVIWRYDPIFFSEITGIQFHIDNYKYIAGQLKGYTKRSVISIVDMYNKAKGRLKKLEDKGVKLYLYNGEASQNFDYFMKSIVDIAYTNSMEIVSCSEPLDLTSYGITPGKCIDDNYIERIFNIKVTHTKDTSQRAACGCVQSKDIGMYDTCLFGCQYCYATSSFDQAKINYQEHDPHSPSLSGWYDIAPPPSNLDLFKDDANKLT